MYLKDNFTGEVTNLSETDYRFRSSKGTFNARFTLQFVNASILNTTDVALAHVTIFLILQMQGLQ